LQTWHHAASIGSVRNFMGAGIGFGGSSRRDLLVLGLYDLYLPQLLTQAGLPPNVGVGLLIFESLVAVLVDLLMGSLSD
jgi:hypothetical protein